jgi:hypothetical protein
MQPARGSTKNVTRTSRAKDTLLAELKETDPLKLRKIEREEIMKYFLKWLFGPGFAFMPEASEELKFKYTEKWLEGVMTFWEMVDYMKWELELQYGELVKFLQQAIEWENMLYVLYPYFWVEDSQLLNLKRELDHPDPIHRAFLKAGAARVVVPIRPGFEDAFLAYLETGDIDAALGIDHPYLTIVQEVLALRNKLPPEGAPVDQWTEFTPTSAMDIDFVIKGVPAPAENANP